MSHKTCAGGCEGVSHEEGAVCNTEGCQNHDKPMDECKCGDDNHGK